MSSSHIQSSLLGQQPKTISLTEEQIALIKEVLKDEDTSIFASEKLKELIQKKHKLSQQVSNSADLTKMEDDIEIPYRILKVKGKTIAEDKYFIVGKGIKSGGALGEGGEGVVKRLIDVDSKKEYAIKAIKLSDDYEDRVHPKLAEYQFKIMKDLGKGHMMVSKTLPENDKKEYRVPKCYIIMELAKGKNLLELLKEHVSGEHVIPTNEWIDICFLILNTVRDLHKKGIWHRDIKLSNFIYDPETKELKLEDYGCAREHKNKDFITESRVLGSVGYQAPEIIDTDIDDWRLPTYSEKTEVYALGQLLREMLGFEEVEVQHDDLSIGTIQNKKANDELGLFRSGFDNLTKSMQKENADDRPSVEKVLLELGNILTTSPVEESELMSIESPQATGSPQSVAFQFSETSSRRFFSETVSSPSTGSSRSTTEYESEESEAPKKKQRTGNAS